MIYQLKICRYLCWAILFSFLTFCEETEESLHCFREKPSPATAQRIQQTRKRGTKIVVNSKGGELPEGNWEIAPNQNLSFHGILIPCAQTPLVFVTRSEQR